MPYRYSPLYESRGYGGGSSGGVNAPYNRASLAAFWPMNEVSGNALDLGPNSITLTASGSPGSSTGLVYPLARSFVQASNQFFSVTNPSALNISAGWTVMAWVKRTGDFTEVGAVWSRYTGADVNSSGSGFIGVTTTVRGSSVSGITQTNLTGLASTVDTWHMFLWSKPAGSSALRLSRDNGAATESSVAIGQTNAGNVDFMIGRVLTADYGPGLIGPVAFWLEDLNAVAGAEAALYNSGNGLAYSS